MAGFVDPFHITITLRLPRMVSISWAALQRTPAADPHHEHQLRSASISTRPDPHQQIHTLRNLYRALQAALEGAVADFLNLGCEGPKGHLHLSVADEVGCGSFGKRGHHIIFYASSYHILL